MGDLKLSKAAFIGAGKIAASLLPAVHKAGVEVIQVISSSIDSARELALKNSITNYADDVASLFDEVDIIFLSVPDSKITPVANEIAHLDISFEGKLFIHLSGAKDIHDLNVLKQKSASIASIHIMQSFPNKKEIDITGSPAAVETENGEISALLFELCKKMKLVPFVITPEAKVYYHMMGVFALNFMSANFYNADRLKIKAGEAIPEANELLVNSAAQTLNNIKEKGAVEALSGPVERGDLATIKKHIEAIKEDKLLLLNYISSCLTLIDIAKEKKSITPAQYSEIKGYLQNELKLVCGNYVNA